MKNPFSLRLIEEREQLGLTQKEFAQVIGISHKTVANYETGQYKAPLTEMAKAGIDITYVITGVRLSPECLLEIWKAMHGEDQKALQRNIISILNYYVKLLQKLNNEDN